MGYSERLPGAVRTGWRVRWACLVPVLALGSPACERPESQDRIVGVVERDSAGIRIIENHAPAWSTTDAWVIDSEPEFAIGGFAAGQAVAVDTAALVWDITSAAPLSNGMVAMLSPRGDSKVLVFEPSGTLFASFGREGRGPGEFSNPRHLQVLPGDTIVVWDHRYGPISYFDPSGTLLRDRRVDFGRLIEMLPEGLMPGESVYSPLPDGSFMLAAREREWRVPARGYYRPPRQFLRIDSTYSATEFGWWGAEEGFRIYPPASAIGYLPFPARSSVAVGGEPLSVYITNGDRYEIHQFSVPGALQRIIRVTSDPVPITTAQLNQWKQGMRAANPNWDWGAWERSFGELAERPFRPAVSRMLVDTQGHLWVFTGITSTEWHVFSEEGRWLGTLDTPRGRTLWVGEDLLILRRTHPDTGVETVVGYRLERGGWGKKCVNVGWA